VVLGEPAAGKSVMALSLTLGLLPAHPCELRPGEPAPVLVTASSWNPHKEDLHRWLARRIVEEYPALANEDVYGPDAAMQLITSKRLVPVLDGLDEITAELQPTAIRAIDQAVSDQYPLVMTCRSTEYRKAVEENRRFLAHAAVLEIQPLGIEDATEFLCGADSHPERWRPVLSHTRDTPAGPLAQALRSPLMVDLARTIYATSAENPAKLLDTALFPHRADANSTCSKRSSSSRTRTAPSGPAPAQVHRRHGTRRNGRAGGCGSWPATTTHSMPVTPARPAPILPGGS
jgi:hypothetical protein